MTTFTNYDLLDNLLEKNQVYFWNSREEKIVAINKLPQPQWECKKIEVVKSFEYTGETHTWALAEDVDLFELMYPKSPDYLCLYRTTRVYGGAAEGGWWWAASELVAVVMLLGIENEAKLEQVRDFLERKAKKAEMRSRQDGYNYYITKELIPGYHHTVGSRYYC